MDGWRGPAAVAVAAASIAAGILFGYPSLALFLANARRRRRRAAGGAEPAPLRDRPEAPVSVIVATRDAPDLVAARIRNVRESTLADGRLECVVAVDAAAPFPLQAYRDALGETARVVAGDGPGGKATALNAGVRESRGGILVFADSAQTFAPDTVARLVARLEGDPELGAVSGLIVQGDSGDGLMDRYWRFEVALRLAQAELHSIICVSGAAYALRRELWRPMAPGLICDDLFVTMSVAAAGRRVGIEPDAHAYDARVFTREQHYARKLRTQVGLWQFLGWNRWAVDPRRNAMWWHLVAHKPMRALVPLALWVAVAAGALAAVRLLTPPVAGLLAGVVAAAVAVLVWRGGALASRLVGAARWMLRLQAVPYVAMGRAWRGDWNVWRAVPVAGPASVARTADADPAPDRAFAP